MDETRVYAVASGKGGVGKTTTAIALGAAAVAAGRSAVVVDADLGMGNLATLLGVESEGPTLHDVLAGAAAPEDAIRAASSGVDVLVSGGSLAGYAAADPAELGGVVDDLRAAYDVVVIDTGAGLSHDTVLPLGLADEVVLVTTPAAIAVDNTEKTREIAERIDTAVGGVLVTRARAGRADGVADALDVPVLGTVPEDDAVTSAAAAGVPVTVHAPESPAAAAYAEAAAAILSVPVSALDVGSSEADADADAIPFAADDETDEAATSDGSGEVDDETDEATTDDGAESGGDAGTADETTPGRSRTGSREEPLVEEAEDEEEQDGGSRSLLSRLSGGLLG